MAGFCLDKRIVQLFKEKLKSGELDPQKLQDMPSSEARRAVFAEFMGDANAEKVNALFEKSLLMKNKEQAAISWAKKVAGITPEVRRDLISTVERMKDILTPESEKTFYADLAKQKLGATVSMKEASAIADLSSNVTKTREAFQNGGDRMPYGRAQVNFGDYVGELKSRTKRMTPQDIVKSPGVAIVKGAVNVAGISKALKATFDNSVIGRQGHKTLFSHPEIWLKNSAQSFVDIVKVFGGKEVLQEVRADVLSRPHALDGLYRKEKLAIGVIEEDIPTNILEKIPGLGRAFKASNEAFTSWQYRTRADVFDKYIDIAEKTGADITGLGKVVNSLTGRGSIGRLEPISRELNNIFFSPRFLKSNLDFLTAHIFEKDVSPFLKKEAAINLLKVITGVSAVLTIANAVKPESVEEDARSADFGKIRVGNTRFDVTGGMASIVTLGFRLARNSTKSSTTEQVKKLNTGKFGSMTRGDVIWNFAKNKFSPAASVINDLLIDEDREGKKPTLHGELGNLFIPLPISNYIELKNDPNSANILLGIIADGLGISVNTYSKKKR